MGCKETASYIFCTWDGLYRLKKLTCLIVGILVVVSSVFSLLNIFDSGSDPLGTIRTIWNILFGVLIIMHEFRFTTWITLRFGFLSGWFGRGMFYLFVGTTIMGTGKEGFWRVFSYVAGSFCLFAGTIELLFGFKCATSQTAQEDEAREAEAAAKRQGATGAAGPSTLPPAGGESPAKKGGWFSRNEKPAQTDPTISVNITPGQAAQGAQWAANNPGTVAAVANAAAPVASAGSSNPNPFFGNNHLSNQR